MATKKLPSFLGSPERDYCTGKLLSLANSLKAEGYKNRYISLAAMTLMMDYAMADGFAEYSYFLDWLENLVQTNRANLTESAEAYDKAEREGRLEEYLASL